MGGQRTLNSAKGISSTIRLIWLLFIERDEHLVLAKNAAWEQAGCRHDHCLALLPLWSPMLPNTYRPIPGQLLEKNEVNHVSTLHLVQSVLKCKVLAQD